MDDRLPSEEALERQNAKEKEKQKAAGKRSEESPKDHRARGLRPQKQAKRQNEREEKEGIQEIQQSE